MLRTILAHQLTEQAHALVACGYAAVFIHLDHLRAAFEHRGLDLTELMQQSAQYGRDGGIVGQCLRHGCRGGGGVALGTTLQLGCNQRVAEVLPYRRGYLLFLDKMQVWQHLDELLAAVVYVKVFLQHGGRRDEQLGCQVEVAAAAPELADFEQLGIGLFRLFG